MFLFIYYMIYQNKLIIVLQVFIRMYTNTQNSSSCQFAYEIQTGEK